MPNPCFKSVVCFEEELRCRSGPWGPQKPECQWGVGRGKYSSSAHLSSLVGILTEAMPLSCRLAFSDHRHPIYKQCLSLGSRAGPSFNLYTLPQCPRNFQQQYQDLDGEGSWAPAPWLSKRSSHSHECQRHKTPTHSQQATYGCTPSSSSKELALLSRLRSLFQIVRSAFTRSPLEGRLLKRSFQTRGSAKAKADELHI